MRAVDHALEIVQDASQIHVIHVLPVIAVSELGGTWEEARDEVRRERTQGALNERFAEDKYHGIQFEVVFGDPGTEIAAYAEEKGAELIVIPSHGRTGLKRLLIGSVAERVCRLAHCSVLVLKE